MGKGGAATGAPIDQRLGAVFVVDVQPIHHGLRVAAGAHRDLRRTGALGNIVKSQEALARAGVSGVEGHLPQIRLRLAPARVVNS